MKKFYSLILSFIGLSAIGQTTFYTESFETTTGYSFPSGNGVGTSNQDFFDRTDSSNAPPQENYNYNSFDGSYFIAGEDIDGFLSTSVGQVYLDNIDISGKSNLTFTAAFASGTNMDIDAAADSISIAVKIDNGSWLVIGRFRADSSTFTSSSGPFNGQFGEDTDNDGYGDGTLLTGTFTDFSWPIIGTGDSLDIRISMDLQSGDEEGAFDNIRIAGTSGTTSSNYTLQILHASDLEGGVEAIDRARYFAAIVDTLEETYANSITLSAGDNYIPGPFFNAAGDLNTFRNGGVFNNVYNRHFGVSSYAALREAPGRGDITIMNIIGFDASALGNHEFDAGVDAIEQIIEEDFRTPNGGASDRWVGAQFPYLSSNLDFSQSADLSDLYSNTVLENTEFVSGPAQSATGNGSINKIAASTYITRGGEKIGVVGATTPKLSSISSPEEVTVKGPTTDDMVALAAEIQPWIDSLTINHGINKIVLVTHLQQVQLEEQLATLLNDVDVIIAGGSDAILANSNDRLFAGSSAYKPYPILTTGNNGNPTAIVSTDGEYKYVGRLVVEFDASGILIPTSIDSTISGPFISDSAMVASTWGTANAFANPNGKAALVDSIASAIRNVVTVKDGNILGKSDVYLNGERIYVRSEETNFGNLSADANLWEAQKVDPSVLVSIKNGGGIRAAIGEVRETSPGVYDYLPPQANPLSGKVNGEVSQLDIENSLRFNNLLSTLDLTATDLKTVLEHGVAAWAVGATPGQFCQVGGVRFSFDPTKAAGNRIQSAIIVDLAGNTIDTLIKAGTVYGIASRTIRVVTLNFLAGGGDGYPFASFATNRIDLDTISTFPAGSFTFANAGSEQDAIAEYFGSQFTTSAYDEEDTEIKDDSRIENLLFRADDIFGVSVEFDDDKFSFDEGAGTVNIQVNYENQSATDVVIGFKVMTMSTTAASDYTITSLSDTAKANSSSNFNLSIAINDDSVIEDDEFFIIEIDADTNAYYIENKGNAYAIAFIRDNDNNGPSASNAITLDYVTSYQGLANNGNSTEISAFDPISKRLFVTNASQDRFEILDLSDPRNIVKVDSISIASFGALNSISVFNSVVAVAIEANTTMGAGTVAFYDTNGVALSNVTVGVLPDMVTFTPNGNKVIVACEGEPSDDYTQDPEGSIGIIDVTGGIANLTNANVTLLNFNAFDSQITSLKNQGVRIFGLNASVSQDMEPEYVAVSPDNNTAYVACQENNAMVIVNLTNNTISSIVPLGWKDHSIVGNGIDSDRKSDEIHIATAPFRGMYLPDAIAAYEVNGINYVISANEGDSRDYGGYSEEERLDDITLNPDSFPNQEAIFDVYGDIKITAANGDIDNDGKYEHIYTYGARSFSIWNGTTGALVYDSGDDFEQIVSNHPEYSVLFNTSEDDLTIKDRSDDKGPEPEAVTIGNINGVNYAFIGMERTGGIMVYDVTNPSSPSFVDINIPRDTATGNGDLAPEGLVFVEKTNSPTGTHLLIASNEVSSTITVWEINDTLTSINELGTKSDLIVYPNPASDKVFISSKSSDINNIEMFDMGGRLIKAISNPKQLETIDLSGLESNLYVIKVYSTSGVKTSKIIVR